MYNVIEKKVLIPKKYEHKIELLLREPQNEDEWAGDGVLFGWTVTFDDGFFMDIDICGVSFYEEGRCNSAWTQAVLFDQNGCEVNCSDVGEDYFGDWVVSCGDNLYTVTLEKEIK